MVRDPILLLAIATCIAAPGATAAAADSSAAPKMLLRQGWAI